LFGGNEKLVSPIKAEDKVKLDSDSGDSTEDEDVMAAAPLPAHEPGYTILLASLAQPDDQSDKKRMRGDISLLKNKYQWACFKVSTRRFRQSAYEQRWLVGQRDGTGLPSSSEEDEEEKEEEVGSAADDEGSDSSFEVGK